MDQDLIEIFFNSKKDLLRKFIDSGINLLNVYKGFNIKDCRYLMI